VDVIEELLVVLCDDDELRVLAEVEEVLNEDVVVYRLTFEPVCITITPTISAITATAPTTPAATSFRPGEPFKLDAPAR